MSSGYTAPAPTATFNGLASGIDSTSIIQKMTQVAQQPIQQIQSKEDGYNQQLAAWQSLNASLASLQNAASTMTLPGTFTATTGTSSNTSVASLTAQPGATLGDHTLTVSQLAQSQKVVTNTVASSTIPLGQSGSFTLNGKTIAVGTNDTLTDLAAKINAASAGVQATVVHVGPNDFRMTLAGTQTGATNALSAADNGTGSVLASLGLFAGASGIRQTVTAGAQTGAGSLALTSATQTVANLLGAAAGSGAAGTVQINGTGVSIDLNADSLTSIAGKINAAGIAGVTAQVIALPDANGQISGNSKQQLQILSKTGAAPTFADSSNVLASLGVLQSGTAAANSISSAQDAKFNLDGLDVTRASNVVNDILPGATVKLLSAGTSTSPATTTLSVTQNTGDMVTSVQNFAAAYNAVQDFITQQGQFTAPTGDSSGSEVPTQPLFGDQTLSQIQNTLASTLTAVAGNNTLGSIGLTVGSNGDLTVDAGTLTTALQTDPQKVANLFGLSGTSDESDVQFVGGSSKTQATNGSSYAVSITQPATQSTAMAGTAQSGASAAPETLTFGGTLFPSGAKITLAQGNTLQDTINQINGDSSLSGQVYASQDAGGHLILSSQQYGTGTGFTVQSDTGATFGTAPQATTGGQDVAGTINGEPATGQGRTLTGNAGNSTTEALKLLVTATQAGTAGHVTVTHGVADALGTALTQILDPTNGSVIGAENSLNSQITDAQQQIQQMQDQVSAYSAYLTQMFSDMETRVSELQSQGAAFAAQVGATSSSSSSKKS